MNSETQADHHFGEQGRRDLSAGNVIQIDELIPEAAGDFEDGYEERIFVRGDMNAGYGPVMQVMAAISAAGYKNIALVTAQKQDK